MVKGSDILRRAAPWIPAAALRPFGRPVALFFHGVTHRTPDPRIEFNHHACEAFRTIAAQLRREFQVLPLDALDEALKHPDRHARTVFLMSDDGYANTATVAADVLDELCLPWTLFVSTEHIETGAFNPLILARLFVHFAPRGTYALPHLKREITLGSDRARARLVAPFLKELKRLPLSRARTCVAAIECAFPAGQLDALRRRFESERYLTWADVKLLHKRGVDIGAHAHWHWPMNACQSEEELVLQATLPRQLIISHIGRCRAFSYPFGNDGDISRAAQQAVRDAGYDAAFTTLSGTLRTGLNRWLLPRYALRPDEPHLPAVVPLLRFGDARVARHGKALAA